MGTVVNRVVTKLRRCASNVPVMIYDFSETWIFWADCSNLTSIKSHENPSNGRRVLSCGQTDMLTDIMTLIVALRNFANTPKFTLFLN